MAKWMIANKKADFDSLAGKFGIRNVTARLIANRLITSRETEKIECSDEAVDAYLNGDLDFLHDPKLMADMEKGAEVMLERIKSGARIRVIGDYDVDGICSSFILVSGLRLLGADVDCVLPDRVKDGYGLSIKLVDDAIEAGIDTIITCDNGIAAFEQVRHAREKGMTVVVTDHHEVPFETEDNGEKKEVLPPADAVIDPKRKDGSYPFSEICGAVVAYKFLQVLTDYAAKQGITLQTDAFFTEMLIFAGIATVCDVMELTIAYDKATRVVSIVDKAGKTVFTATLGKKATPQPTPGGKTDPIIDPNPIKPTGFDFGLSGVMAVAGTGILLVSAAGAYLFTTRKKTENA